MVQGKRFRRSIAYSSTTAKRLSSCFCLFSQYNIPLLYVFFPPLISFLYFLYHCRRMSTTTTTSTHSSSHRGGGGRGGGGRGGGARGGGGRGDRGPESALVQLSKQLSYLLRHGAVKEGLTISSDGFVSMEDMIKHTRYSFFFAFLFICLSSLPLHSRTLSTMRDSPFHPFLLLYSFLA